MASFASPKSFRLANLALLPPVDRVAQSPFMALKGKPHEMHPSFDHLVLLVFEAVMEVVCVSLPGYIVARLGHFDADKQKFLANLNMTLFTPCLIFTKLASQLNADKLVELAIIPVLFVLQTLVSYAASRLVSKAFRFNKRATNFVTAMGVFGNSNSLPISMVLSLSQTISGLHWDKIPGDNDDEVSARGILYLVIFQQLGQVLRWTWGYNVLLAPKETYDECNEESAEEGRYRDAQPEEEREALINDVENLAQNGVPQPSPSTEGDSEGYEPCGATPVDPSSRVESEDEREGASPARTPSKRKKRHANGSHPPDYHVLPDGEIGRILSFPRIHNSGELQNSSAGFKGYGQRLKLATRNAGEAVSATAKRTFVRLPRPLQTALAALWRAWLRVYTFLWEFMNPPLWAMVLAIIVASVPSLQRLFFQEGSFIKNSVTGAVSQSAGVAVPLILVVLGANLARNTQQTTTHDAEAAQIGTRLLVASLLCRMVLPTLIMAPIIAVFAKYVPVSILDDPIFVIVVFLLTGAPSALQLAQICQINGVYETVMARILFQSYVIWILPSTLFLVMAALEVVEWAK